MGKMRRRFVRSCGARFEVQRKIARVLGRETQRGKCLRGAALLLRRALELARTRERGGGFILRRFSFGRGFAAFGLRGARHFAQQQKRRVGVRAVQSCGVVRTGGRKRQQQKRRREQKARARRPASRDCLAADRIHRKDARVLAHRFLL